MRRWILVSMVACVVAATGQTREQTGGIYYCYPEPTGEYTTAPVGYKPVYISHYGRHGSRWVTDDKRYTDVMDAFADTTVLTPLGMDVRRRLEIVLDDALGRSGSLSPVGERQHRDIAARMYERSPEVFADGAVIDAVSSTSLRCAMSMSYFTESLKERNPNLRVKRTAYDKDMAYIAYTSPEGKRFSADTAAWRQDYWRFVYETVDPNRVIASLFTNADDMTPQQRLTLATGLYWIASDMQDIDLDMDLYDIFTYDELRSYWRCVNARMYICNGNAPLADGVMIHCADHLLQDIIAKADAALDAKTQAGSLCYVTNADSTGWKPVLHDRQYASANLRFGHDTHLLRLLALMGIEGCTGEETDIYRFDSVWRDYELSPMAANLQMIFYKNASGDILVKMLLNEREVTMPLPSATAPYYSWNELRPYLISRLQK